MITFNTRVRPAVLGDTFQMTKLLNAIIVEGGTTAHQLPLMSSELAEKYLLAPQLISCNVAISNGQLSGFQYLGWDTERGDWSIIATFVGLDRAKMGIGQKLFAATRFAAKQAGVKTIDATIRADNIGGLKYYGGLGFTDYDVLRQIPLADGTLVDRIRKKLDL